MAHTGLLRILGVTFGIAVIIGATIGVGILRTPGLVASHLGTRSLIVWVWLLGGLYTLLGSICLTELGAMLPRAGGYYVYARQAFGNGVGFAVGWTDWLTYCSVLGYVSIAIGEFSAALIPALQPKVTIIAAGTLVVFAALQRMGLRVSSGFQQITSLLKFLAFVLLVIACFALAVDTGPIREPVPVRGWLETFAAVVLALQSVVVTYGGWQSALYFTEEDRDPARHLPRAMIGGVVLVIIIYMLVNLAFLYVLPLPQLAASTLPAADAARALFGAFGGEIITVLSLISLPPLINAILMIGTRILFAMGRDGLLAPRAARVNERGTPGTAMLMTAGAALLLVATGTFEKLIAMTAFFLAANYAVCCLALIVLRVRDPLAVRPFRAWGYPLSAYIVLAGALVFLGGVIVTDPRNSSYALMLLAASLPLYLVSRRRAVAPVA